MHPPDEIRQTATTEEQIAAKRAALIREREGYVAAGKDDRVAAVDAELDRLDDPGEDPAADAPRARAERRPRRATAAAKSAEQRG